MLIFPCSLVASAPAQNLLFCADHLFVGAMMASALLEKPLQQAAFRLQDGHFEAAGKDAVVVAATNVATLGGNDLRLRAPVVWCLPLSRKSAV